MTPAGGRARVLVAGDANPDLVLRGDVTPRFGQAEQLLDAADLVIGGSAAIAAHGLARLERPVALVAAVGDDVFGRQLLGQLTAGGVDVGPVVTRAGVPTGLTVVLSRGDDRAIFTLTGAIATLTADEVCAAVDSARERGAAHLHVASLFLQPALAADLAAVLGHARARGLTTSLDTNDDPAGTWAGVADALGLLDLLLPNRAEVTALGGEADLRRAAGALAAAGPLVVVKDGPNGAFAVDPAGTYTSVPGQAVRLVDTTGAGDTFDAAFLDAHLDGAPLETSLRRAVAAGAQNVGSAGGTAGQPTRADLETQRGIT